MILFLNALSRRREIQHFSCQLDELNTCFEILNAIVAKGDVLLEASLLEEDQQAPLPIAAFEGISFTFILKHLESEWQALLREPVRSLPQTLADRWCQQKIQECDQRIFDLELLISDTYRLFHRAQQRGLLGDETVVARYGSILTRYQSQLAQVQQTRKRVFDRTSKTR